MRTYRLWLFRNGSASIHNEIEWTSRSDALAIPRAHEHAEIELLADGVREVHAELVLWDTEWDCPRTLEHGGGSVATFNLSRDRATV